MALDWNNALTGAMTGGGIGTIGGPLGTAAGAIGGGLLGLLGGGKSKQDKLQNYNPYSEEQQNFINQLAELVQQGNLQAFQYLNQILSDDPELMEQFEAPLREKFEQQEIPSILERMTNRGTGSAGGSALNQSLGEAAKGLYTNLAAQRANLKGSAINALQQYGNQALTKMNTPYTQKGSPGIFKQLSPYAAQGIGPGFG